MNLNNFLEDVYGKEITEENVSPEEAMKEAEKFIKNIKKVRFNQMFKELNRIYDFMNDQGATVRGLVKKTILNGAMELFKQSRERSQQYRKSKNDAINQAVEKFMDKVKLEGSLASVVEDVEFERLTFEKIMERIADNTFSTVTNNDQMTFFITQFLKTDMLESPEERKYHDRALEIIEYFVIQTMLMRIVLSMIQTIIARIASKIKLSKVDDAERKAKASTDVLIKFFRNFVENKFGNEVGKYLSTYVEDYYQSTQDQKEQFVKFENLVNVLIGIK
jgi:hypothetical protein